MARYRVVGSRRVRGTDPGKTFDADLAPGAEQALIAGGHIVRTSIPKKSDESRDATSIKENESDA